MKLEDIKDVMLIKSHDVKSDQELRDDIISQVIECIETSNKRLNCEIRTCGDIHLYVGAILNELLERKSAFTMKKIFNIFMENIKNDHIKHWLVFNRDKQLEKYKPFGNSMEFIKKYCTYMSDEDLLKLIKEVCSYEN